MDFTRRNNMSAISDYLETKLLNFIFRQDATFTKPTNISVALLNTVPKENDDGSTMDEVDEYYPIEGGADVPTQYARVSLGRPSEVGNTWWNDVGSDLNSAYVVYTAVGEDAGYNFPVYLSQARASNAGGGASLVKNYDEYPGVNFYIPDNGTATLGAENDPDPDQVVYRRYDGNGFIQNKKNITFEQAGVGWGDIVAVALMDSSTYGEGNILMYTALEKPKTVDPGDIVQFLDSSLEISLK